MVACSRAAISIGYYLPVVLAMTLKPTRTAPGAPDDPLPARQRNWPSPSVWRPCWCSESGRRPCSTLPRRRRSSSRHVATPIRHSLSCREAPCKSRVPSSGNTTSAVWSDERADPGIRRTTRPGLRRRSRSSVSGRAPSRRRARQPALGRPPLPRRYAGGIVAAGATAIDVGELPTPALYFAVARTRG